MLPGGGLDMRRFYLILLTSLVAIALSLFTVWAQVSPAGRDYLETEQYKRHEAVMQEQAGDPWQYRILSEYAVELAIYLAKELGIPRHVSSAFVAVRLLQNVIIFLLVALYYRRLGLSFTSAIIGMSILGWGMTYALYDSDLQFNTYSDIIFYLLAVIVLIEERFWLIVPITLMAALNRESSGFIPFLTAGVAYMRYREGKPASSVIKSALLAALVFVAVFFGLRWFVYGPQEMVDVYGMSRGYELVTYNLGRVTTWIYVFGTLGVIPIVAISAIRRWPPTLRAFFWILAPAWFVLHVLICIIAETRIFLVPHAIVLIPGALFAITDSDGN
jgi:hypothetical protein